MGLENFSMHPNALLEVKQVINETNLEKLPQDTLEIMNAMDVMEAQAVLDRINLPLN
jgi:phosphotransferase system enzyme I (PtsI)